MRCGHRRFFLRQEAGMQTLSKPYILIIRPLPQVLDNHRHHVFLSNSLYKTVNTTMEPVTGIEPAPAEWKSAVLPLHHAGMMPRKALSWAGLLYHFPNGVAPFEVVRSLGIWDLSHGCDGSGIPPAAAPSFRGAMFFQRNWLAGSSRPGRA